VAVRDKGSPRFAGFQGALLANDPAARSRSRKGNIDAARIAQETNASAVALHGSHAAENGDVALLPLESVDGVYIDAEREFGQRQRSRGQRRNRRRRLGLNDYLASFEYT
jgi:hypothetical protein